MYEQQQLFDLQDNNNGTFGNVGADPSCWLSNENPRGASTATANANVDPLLFNDLVQIVPLVQSLIDRKAKTSFNRRGSMTYTKMPSRESLYKKVYDSVEWPFLKMLLLEFGFPSIMVDWIMECVTTVSYSLLINGGLTPAFPAKKGLRQGDPMSPYLFVLAMEYLHRSFQQLRNNPQFKHHPRCAKMNLFHICFADDLRMCCRADTISIHLLFQAFQHFSEVSGLQANMEKSSLYIAGLTVKSQILEELHLTAGELPFKYLGVPLSTRKLTSSEAKGRNTSQSTATKKHRDQNKNVGNNQDGCAENFSMSSSRSSLTEKDREELISLRVQVEDLQKKLLEKDELLKEVDILKNEITAAYAELDGLKKGISEKDFSLKSTQVQLSDAQVKLADKKAAIERLEWEAMTSSNKVERLQEDVDRVQEEISSFMQFVRALTENDSRGSAEEYDVIPYLWDQSVEIDNLNGAEMQKLEEAREAYIAAVVAAKENQDEAYLSAAATARSYLQSLVLTT